MDSKTSSDKQRAARVPAVSDTGKYSYHRMKARMKEIFFPFVA